MDNQTSTPNKISEVAPTPVYTMTTPPVPPTPPTPPNVPLKPERYNNLHVLLPAALLLLILGAGYFWYSSRMDNGQDANNSLSEAEAKAAASSFVAAPLPEGFPEAIPLEAANLASAGKIDYPEGATQYMASFSSKKSIEDLWAMYTNFIKNEGFTLNEKGTDKTQGVLDARKDKNVLNVLITGQGSESVVNITYVKR